MPGTESAHQLKYLQALFRLRDCKFLKHVIPNIRVLYKKNEQVNTKRDDARQYAEYVI